MNVGEKEAKKAGFTKCELMATQAGVSLYKNHGYIAGRNQLRKCIRSKCFND